MVSMMDTSRNVSFDSNAILSFTTLNGLHFPGLSTSGISDSGGNSRRTSFLHDGSLMSESMTESFSSITNGQDDAILVNQTNILQIDSLTSNNSKVEKRDSFLQKRRRSRKSQFDASLDGTIALDKIEPVYLFEEENESDDAWLYEVPKNEQKKDSTTDNIFSWVHKEFKTNDIKASRHLLLCKLDDMSNARTIRSSSCHSFAHNQKADNVKRSLTDQEMNLDPNKNDHLRSVSPFNLSPLQSNIIVTSAKENSIVPSTRARSRDTSKERDRGPLDYTDIEVMAKMQLENLRQAERKSPLSHHFGGSNASLASTSSVSNALTSRRTETKPPVAPKPIATRNGIRPNNTRTATLQTNTKSNNHDAPAITQSKSTVITAARTSLLPPNSANNIRTRPPVTTRPFQIYRGSQTSFNNTDARTQVTPSSSLSASIQRNLKKVTNSTNTAVNTKELTSNGNGLLNDVSNRPLTAPTRSQVAPQRRTLLPHSSTYTAVDRIPSSSSSVNIKQSRQTIIPRSSSSTISQGRKSGIPMAGTQQKSGTTTLTRHHSLSSRRTTMNGF